jgi:hypothetical protein
MAKILGLGALFMYASLGVASGVGDIQQQSDRGSLTLARSAVMEAAGHGGTIQATSSTGRPVAPHQMSPEEKERRQDECVTLHDACYDRCTKAHKTAKKQEPCYRECAEKLADCMARIPD